MRLPENQTNGSSHNGIMVNGNKSPKVSKMASLPIHLVRSELVRELRDNDTLIVMGETGSGKTTQLPQFIQDARLITGQIGVTQPRRVAAITVAKRVADERSGQLGEEVGYCVRFDEKMSEKTRIKFLTDGMLLREAQRDPSLKRYGCIILDEAHERTIQTDILFGIVKKAQRVRTLKAGMSRLKVIVMSATMDVDHFSKYFNCRVLYLEGRTHPVSVYYSHQNFDDYIGATLSTILDLHKNPRLPVTESILVFLTGRDEIEACQKALKDQTSLSNQTLPKMEVLPLYASLSPQQQIRVFEPVKPGRRRVILATNVAETSITIPGIKHVVDPGRVKQKQYQPGSGMELLKITKCSKAQAWQRAGRAGRESAGSVYRLYTEQHFTSMATTTQPEIERSPLATVAMQLLAAGIKNVRKFEFLDAPPIEAIRNALEELVLLGVAVQSGQEEYDLTDLGRKIARFPLEPRLTKALLIAAELKCSEEAIIIAALLSTENIFIFPANRREEAKVVHQKFYAAEGDLTTMLNVYKAYNRISKPAQKNWCHEHFLNARHLSNVQDIRKQLREIFTSLNLNLASSGGDMRPVRQSFARGMFMNCAELKPDGHYEELGHKQTVKIHPSSVLFGTKPQFIIFNELIETNNLYIRSIITAEPEWVIREAPGWFRSRLALND